MGGSKNKPEKKASSKEFHFQPFRELSKIKNTVDAVELKNEAPPLPKVLPQKIEVNDTAVLSDDHLLNLAMSGVMPIEGPAQAPKIARAKPMHAEANDDVLVMRELDELVNGDGDFDFADTEEFIEACRADLDRRILKRLRKGEFSFQAHIDLHGMNRQEARAAVGEFIKQSFVTSKKCVLIVHGRGLGSRDNIPVIKNKLAAWLTRGSIGKKVLAYTSALPTDGGTGAVYVLLASP
jgi:DNA-nicking Smr family endonuclease